jgi:uncharacterized protein (DUF697 family)
MFMFFDLHQLYLYVHIRVTAAAGVIAAIPVPFIDAGINIIVLANEVRHYMSVFGINRENVYSLENFDHSLLR